MKIKFITILVLSLAYWVTPASISAQTEPAENFSAVAFLPSGAGRAMIGAGRTLNVDIHVERYSSDNELQTLEQRLLSGGSASLRKELEKMKSIGRISLTGRLGIYDLKLIRTRDVEGGRRVIAVTDRPISGLEAFYGSRSKDYEFGILELLLTTGKKGKEKGEGALIYAARVKLISSDTVEIENYGITPIQLRSVREL